MYMHAPPALYICKYIDVHTHTNDIPTPPLQHGASHVHNTRVRTQDKENHQPHTHTQYKGGVFVHACRKSYTQLLLDDTHNIHIHELDLEPNFPIKMKDKPFK